MEPIPGVNLRCDQFGGIAQGDAKWRLAAVPAPVGQFIKMPVYNDKSPVYTIGLV